MNPSRPPVLRLPSVELPAIRSGRLNNGIEVLAVERHTLPLIACGLVLHAGAERDIPRTSGAAMLTGDLLDAGAGGMDLMTIASHLDFMGATIDVQTTVDGAAISTVFHTRHRDGMMSLLAALITSPTFPEGEFLRLRDRRIASVLQQKDRPGMVANNAFHRLIYGPGHPYGHNPLGTEQSLASLTAAEIARFWQRSYTPESATLVIVGDMVFDDFLHHCDALLGGWQQEPSPPPDLSSVAPDGKSRVYLVDKPGATQAEIRIGCRALPRNTPDYFAAALMNRILGGQFTSRLNLNLRERHGLTYGVHSGFSFHKQPGPFIVSAAVQTEKTPLAVREVLNELQTLVETGVTAEELEFAKKGMAGGLVQNFETPLQIAWGLQNIALFGLPHDYYARYIPDLQKVTREEILGLAREVLDPARMAIVVVGDSKALRASMHELKVGDVAECDSEGTICPTSPSSLS
jgi:zinc protease